MKIIFATGNQHKLKEATAALKNKFELVNLKDVGITEDIPENENTIKGNAIAKMKYVVEKTGQNCFADDTGLEVEALNGEPGVYSARYAGEHCSFQDNVDKLLKNLEGIENRNARFVTVIALHLDGEEHYFEGVVEGVITKNPSGTDGFGYDPIFKPNNYDITFSEMPLDEKNKISHRGRALQKLSDFLTNKK
jgi:XTP/dITP diphosphohydrolase